MQEPDNRMIDVIEEFSCPHQTDAYLEAFRNWRRKKKNRYSFRFTRNPKEAAFSENQSVVSETPAQSEKLTLHRLGMLIGFVLICCLMIENILDKILVVFLGRFGVRIEVLYWGESRLYGEEQAVFWLTAIIYLLKFLVPALILFAVLRMPLRVCLPLHIARPNQLLAGTLLMMLMSMGFGMFFVSRSGEMEKYRLISDAVNTDDKHLMLYMLFTVLISPLVTEFLLHGCMFQVLRQFGDPFAIGAISFLAAFLTHNLQDAVRVGLVALTISYFMVKTGSFLTAALLHIVHEIYMFALFYIETFKEVYSVQWWILVLVPCLVGTIAGIYLLIYRKLHPEPLFRTVTYLTVWDQVSAFFTNMPMLAFLICSVLLMVSTAILA